MVAGEQQALGFSSAARWGQRPATNSSAQQYWGDRAPSRRTQPGSLPPAKIRCCFIFSLLCYICRGPSCLIHRVPVISQRTFHSNVLWGLFHNCLQVTAVTQTPTWRRVDLSHTGPPTCHTSLSLSSPSQIYGFQHTAMSVSTKHYAAEQHRARVPPGTWTEMARDQQTQATEATRQQQELCTDLHTQLYGLSPTALYSCL